MSQNLPSAKPFPVDDEDIIASIKSSIPFTIKSSPDGVSTPQTPPTRTSSPVTTAPGSARNTPPPSHIKLPLGGSGFLNISQSSLFPSRSTSRRTSNVCSELTDSRRGSVKSMATDAVKDLRKGVKSAADTTKKAGYRVKDKTTGMGAHVVVATVGASKWVANRTSKKAKLAMDQARGGLTGGEKFTLFAFEKIRALSRRGFTHVFMFLILIGYTALGALLFMAFEAPHEDREKITIHKEKMIFLNNIWNMTRTNYDDFVKDAKRLMLPFEEQLCTGCVAGVGADSDTRVWTFWKAMFFCSTITTTIGYGHITPKTNTGRALTIVYSIIGIPLFLILITDFGTLFTRALKSLFVFIRKCYRSEACRRVRKAPRVLKVVARLKAFRDTVLFWWKDDKKEPKSEDEERGEIEKKRKRDEELDKMFADGNFNLPISLALGILMLYIVIGCFLYISWESWTLFEAFYFIFISMTTIGFGDYVPEHQAFMMATAVYLVFGLALTAMCINIIQEKLTHTFSQATVKFKESFSNIMASASVDGEDDEGKEDSIRDAPQ